MRSPTPSTAIRVFVVDDHSLMRRGLGHILAEASGIEVVGEAGDGGSLLSAAGVVWDVLLLDLVLPDHDGLDLIRTMKRKFPDRGILVLSMKSEEVFGVRAIQAGADGYVTKNASPRLLVGAIRRIAAGEREIGPGLASQLADRVASGWTGAPHERLSERKFQILRLIVQGKALKECARILHVSAKTVTTYRGRLMGKMGFESNVELFQYAMEHGLIDRTSPPGGP